ncbi:MAG: hypothetical protein VW270_13430 [Candidatus Poseidoniales archaeon]
MAQSLYAYKGFVYKLELDELVIVDRYMEFRDNGHRISLNEWGEITLNNFKEIVDSYINRNPV